MAAVKRTLFKFRLGDDADDQSARDDPTPMLDEDVAADDEPEDDGPGRPYAWVGLAVASLAGLAAAGYKLVQYRRSAKEAEREEPWRVEEEPARLPDDRGTASLVGLVFVGGLAAIGKRLERDDWE